MRMLSSSSSVPPCPTNNRTVRVLGGHKSEPTSSRSSPTVLLNETGRPGWSSSPLPNASIGMKRLGC